MRFYYSCVVYLNPTDVIYARQTIYIKYILTHAEYDKGGWKNDLYSSS
ncbi:MAG: type II toxin-antitoxin system HigB family toxin [Cyanobacterium sp. T60_A2020_053]|nr:type II toxin-antitoxin system HigB family toxin [Cyanobacterium sp. T60_A2020_053]